MDGALKERLIVAWEKYFGREPLPLVFFYSDDERYREFVRPVAKWMCMIGRLATAGKGGTVVFAAGAVGCHGGERYCGFREEVDRDHLKHFLSCGLPGKIEGERYKRTPALAERYIDSNVVPSAKGTYLVFKRWDRVEEAEQPEAVVVLCRPDVLSGMFTLANFGAEDLQAVVTPFCAGCGALVAHPVAEGERDEPRATVGLFDVSARPYVPADTLSFAAPWGLWCRMVDDMDESFLITPAWDKVARRLARSE